MSFYIQFGWLDFSIAFGVMLLLTFIMGLQSSNFYTNHVVVRKFSMLDLEFPASRLELVNYIKGIFLLPADLSQKTLRSLKGQLYIDFLFMIAAYGSVFILCMKVSMKMNSFGIWVFATMAWLQIIALVCDIIENIYLLKKIKPEPRISTESTYRAIKKLEYCKWIIPLGATVSCLAIMAYLWLLGDYSYNSTEYAVLIIAELAVFFVLKKGTEKSDNEKLAEFRE